MDIPAVGGFRISEMLRSLGHFLECRMHHGVSQSVGTGLKARVLRWAHKEKDPKTLRHLAERLYELTNDLKLEMLGNITNSLK